LCVQLFQLHNGHVVNTNSHYSLGHCHFNQYCSFITLASTVAV